ncbi:hypothetical protein L7F22_000084 [Adiantum nelumboides]|nr:hypothetical protein [Adiantum nelumboides]
MVARRAGTSVSTVSLVVNGKSRGRVSAVITERVRAAVDELGYVVDHAASSLARGTTDLVVLLAPDLPNPYFGRVTTGIREALGSRHQLMLSVIEGGEQPGADDVRRVAAFRPAGLLVHAPSPTFLDDLEPGGPPLVLMDAPGFEGRAATVTFDLEPGVRALVAHLAEAGHTVLAYLEGSTPSATFTVRRELLARVAAEHGLRVLDDGTRAGLTLDAAADVGTEALPRWRAAGATAVVAAADTMAYGVLAAAHRLGLAVPGDIAVAGGWPPSSPGTATAPPPPCCPRGSRPGPAPAADPPSTPALPDRRRRTNGPLVREVRTRGPFVQRGAGRGASAGSAAQHLRDEERQLQALLGVQPRVAGRLVAAGEVGVGDPLRTAEALGDVLAGDLDVDAAGVRAERAVHLEEALHLVDDPVEVPGLVAGRGLVGVAVHRVALPDDLVPGGGDLLDDRREHVADLAVAHPADQRQPARAVVRVEPLDVLDGLVRRRRRADLQPDRVGQQLREGDVRAVELAGALPDPEEVRGQVVEPRRVPAGGVALQVQAQHGALVVEQQRLVAGVELDLVQVVVVHPAGVHEPDRAVDLGGDRLVPHARRGRPDEVLVPVVDLGQVGQAGRGQAADQVHRRARVGVGAHHPRRVRDPAGRVGRQAVDDVAAVGRQAHRVDVGAARLGVLPGDPPDLHHRHRGAVGQHDGHLQQRADGGADVRLGVVDERLGAVAALQQERLPVRDVGEPRLQPVDLRRQHHRRDGLEDLPHVAHLRRVGPLGLLGGRAGERVVQGGAQLAGEARDRPRQRGHRTPQLAQRHVVVGGDPGPQLDVAGGAGAEVEDLLAHPGPRHPGPVAGRGQFGQHVGPHPLAGPVRVELGGHGVELPPVLADDPDRDQLDRGAGVGHVRVRPLRGGTRRRGRWSTGRGLLLDRRRVEVDVGLPGQLHQRVHDLVGHGALDEPVAGHALVPGEVQRLADPDLHLARPPHPGADRVDLVGADHRDRDDRHPGLQGHPRDAGLALVEPAVGRAGALRVDAEQLALAQQPDRGVHRGPRRRPAGAVHRDLPDAGEELLLEEPADAGLGEVLALGEERDPARDQQRQEERVGHREVVAGEDRAGTTGHVLGTAHLRPAEQPHQRAQQHELGPPVQHPALPPYRLRRQPTERRHLLTTGRWSPGSGGPRAAPARARGRCRAGHGP